MHGQKNITFNFVRFNPLNAELNPICQLLALLGAHHILHVGRVRVKCNLNRLLVVRKITIIILAFIFRVLPIKMVPFPDIVNQ